MFDVLAFREPSHLPARVGLEVRLQDLQFAERFSGRGVVAQLPRSLTGDDECRRPERMALGVRHRHRRGAPRPSLCPHVQVGVGGETRHDLHREVGVASLAPPSAVAAWVKGAELSLVAGGIERALNVLMVNPKIKRVEDLKGKRVAISRFGSLSDVSLRDALAFYKLRANQDVQVAQMGGLGERMVALTSGVVDGAILNVDQVFQAEKLGFQILIDLRKLPLTYSTQGIVVSREFLRAQRNIVKRFLKVYIEGIKIFKTDKEFSMDTLSRYIKTSDREILSKTYDVYRDAWETVPLVRRDGIQQALDSIPDAKNTKLNLDSLIDNSLIRELEKEGFIRELYPERTR